MITTSCDYHKSFNENEKNLIMVTFGFSRLLWFESAVLFLVFGLPWQKIC